LVLQKKFIQVDKNYYQLFGVDQYSSQEQIQKSYAILLNRFKPDPYSTDGDIPTIVNNINRIYAILSDTEERKNYDIKLNKEAEEEQTQTPSFVVNENTPGSFVSNDPFSPMLGQKNERMAEEIKEGPIKLSESVKWIIRILAFGVTMWGIIHKYVN